VRANPGKYSYASAGLGTPGHLAGELFRSPLGLDLVHVPFSGGPPAINATIAGHTPVSFTALPTAAPQVKDGKLRALAVMSSKRAAALPDVLTMAEAGVPDCEVDIVAGMVVRSETPDDIAQRLHGEIVKALAQPEIRERLSALGFEPVASTRDQFAAWINAEIPRWRRVIHGVNIPKVE
jgi:tripartite-type tricarboxylate transporter receptor subunit TctC